jgi:hypothetical protein
MFNNGALKEKLYHKMEKLEKNNRVGGSIGLGGLGHAGVMESGTRSGEHSPTEGLTEDLTSGGLS